jgi:hypothetical protein
MDGLQRPSLPHAPHRAAKRPTARGTPPAAKAATAHGTWGEWHEGTMAAATRPLEAAPSRRPGWPGHPHTRASRARTRGVPAAARPRPSYAAEMLPQAPSYLYSRLKCRGGVVRHSGDDGCRCSAEMPPTGGATVMSRPADVPPTGGAPVPGRTGLIGCGCEAARPRTPGHSRVPPTTSPRPAEC